MPGCCPILRTGEGELSSRMAAPNNRFAPHSEPALLEQLDSDVLGQQGVLSFAGRGLRGRLPRKSLLSHASGNRIFSLLCPLGGLEKSNRLML